MMKDLVRPCVVVSKCLEFEACRYDGTQISDPFIKKMKSYIDFIPVCPEMEIGLPTPRQALRLVEVEGKEQLVFSQTGESVTSEMEHYIVDKVGELAQLEVDGFVLKSRSPSCGIKEVKIYKTHGKSPALSNKGKGLFGKAILDGFDGLAIEDEGRMSNYQIREHFLTRIYTHAAFRAVKKETSMRALVKFHSQNKYLFMAYHPSHLKTLGKLVANHEQNAIEEVLVRYETVLNKLLSTPPNTMRFINMMLHIFGHFSKELNVKEKAYFLDMIEQYRNHQIPQSTVMALLKSWVIRFDIEYLIEQKIFEPYPHEIIEVRDSGKGV
jgi:uncharacterized protein YbgA (DUF1722 family)/uncharacterized protein YbbK (DUF523 family)